MPIQNIRVFTPTKARRDILTRRQKIFLVSVTGIILLALILFLLFTFRTTWIVLYHNSDFTVMSQVSDALDDAEIRNRLSSCLSRIYVPARNYNEAHGVILRNITTATSLSLVNVINLMGLGTTEAVTLHITRTFSTA